MKYMYDVVVVGAGPSGTAAARACAAAGLATLCIEEHAAIGYPVQCAGLLSCEAFAGCRISDRSVLHAVQGARVCFGEGEALTFRAPETKAYIVDRGTMDREMARAAADAGAEFLLKAYVSALTEDRVVVRGAGGAREIP